MKRFILLFVLIILSIFLVGMGEVFAQQANVYPPGGSVENSRPLWKWCSGPHKFRVDVTAKVHQWLFAWISGTRIHYEVWKPGNYWVRKKLWAMSNEPISITIAGVDPLRHINEPTFPKIIHHAWITNQWPPFKTDEIIRLTDPGLADAIDPNTGNEIPNWTEPEDLEADPDWIPGTRMPDAVAERLGVEEGIVTSEELTDTNTPGLAPLEAVTVSTNEASDVIGEDRDILNYAPQQFRYPGIPIGPIVAGPFIARKWLYDSICVRFINRSCLYEDPGGYVVTVTANPKYPHTRDSSES